MIFTSSATGKCLEFELNYSIKDNLRNLIDGFLLAIKQGTLNQDDP